jgi:hypothetical protein
MNILISLAPEEIEALMDFHADKIGQGDEAESDLACARIEQLRRLQDPATAHDIEDIAA